MRIEVTQEDIDKGERVNCYRCPIALAVKRASGESKNVAAGICDMHIGGRIYATPREARLFIRQFDGGLRVEPFAFELGEPR